MLKAQKGNKYIYIEILMNFEIFIILKNKKNKLKNENENVKNKN